ncbi:MAG: hypothetical protein H7Z14_01165 [Anaerolineae bacterium]|nr:hypothetical protein [Phycisphaerae bacterium]
MINFRSSSVPGTLTAIMVAVGGLFAFGQYAVNRQVGQPVYGGSGGGGGGSVRYGYVAPVAYKTSTLLPSEVRNNYYRSGAMPSDIRMNYRAAGPLAAGGAAAYIPGGSPVVIRAGSAPQGNMVNPMGPRPPAQAGLPIAPSIHYGAAAGQVAWATPMHGAVQLQPSGSAIPTSSMSANPFGTIHYPNSR